MLWVCVCVKIYVSLITCTVAGAVSQNDILLLKDSESPVDNYVSVLGELLHYIASIFIEIVLCIWYV